MTSVLLYSTIHARAALAWTKKKLKKKQRSLRNEKLKANRASETKGQRRERLRIRREKDRASRRKKQLQVEKKRLSETEDHEKQRLATLKRLKRGDENELERNLRLEKVVASKQLRLAVLTEEQNWRMMQLPNGSGWPWRRTKKEKQDWRRWLQPHISGWPWRQRKKEEQKRNGFDLDLISKTHFFQGMSSLAL